MGVHRNDKKFFNIPVFLHHIKAIVGCIKACIKKSTINWTYNERKNSTYAFTSHYTNTPAHSDEHQLFLLFSKSFFDAKWNVKMKNYPVNFCFCVIDKTWWLVHSFSKISPRILIRLTWKKNWCKPNWIENSVLREKLKKNGLTILPWQKLDLPSYYGIVGGCRSQLKSKLHSLISLPWKFQLHIDHNFRERQIWKRSKG